MVAAPSRRPPKGVVVPAAYIRTARASPVARTGADAPALVAKKLIGDRATGPPTASQATATAAATLQDVAGLATVVIKAGSRPQENVLTPTPALAVRPAAPLNVGLEAARQKPSTAPADQLAPFRPPIPTGRPSAPVQLVAYRLAPANGPAASQSSALKATGPALEKQRGGVPESARARHGAPSPDLPAAGIALVLGDPAPPTLGLRRIAAAEDGRRHHKGARSGLGPARPNEALAGAAADGARLRAPPFLSALGVFLADRRNCTVKTEQQLGFDCVISINAARG